MHGRLVGPLRDDPAGGRAFRDDARQQRRSDALGIVNTSLWGVLLGYAFFRSGDLWLPIGLHLGWNWMLPVFGVNLSGFTMDLDGLRARLEDRAAVERRRLRPRGGLLTSAVVVLLFVYLWKAPVRRQTPFLLRESEEV